MIHLVVTCAKDKTAPVPPDLHLRAVRRGSIAARAAAWIERLRADGPTCPARELYAGAHWAAARRAAALADVVRVASAGYGLVPLDAPLQPYSATFALGDPDSVVQPRSRPSDPSAWWDALAAWPGPVPGAPRRIADLAADPKAFVLVVTSAAYLRALAPDIAAAPDRVAVICGGANCGHSLAERLLPCDARLQSVVGGALVALNARVAEKLLADPPPVWSLAAARDKLAAWLDAAPLREVPNRRGIDDEEVTAFIRRNPSGATPSALLRELRDRGLACAYSRFVRLFNLARKG